VLDGYLQLTRLIPNSQGTTCNQRIEKIVGTQHSRILRIPFRHNGTILKKWISRFDVYPYLETYAEVNTSHLKQRSFLHRLDYAFLSAFPRGFLLLWEQVVIVFCPILH
jgi:sucrose synthase